MHEKGPLADPLVGLTQLDPEPLGQSDQNAPRLEVQARIGRKGDRLFLHGGIDVDPLHVLFGQLFFAFGGLQRFA